MCTTFIRTWWVSCLQHIVLALLALLTDFDLFVPQSRTSSLSTKLWLLSVHHYGMTFSLKSVAIFSWDFHLHLFAA